MAQAGNDTKSKVDAIIDERRRLLPVVEHELAAVSSRSAHVRATCALLKELLSTHALVGNLADHWQLTLGISIIVLVALLPKGVMGIGEQLARKKNTGAEHG